MPSKNLKANKTKQVLAIDLGGTKLALARVDYKGQILEHMREPMRANTPEELIAQILRGCSKILKNVKVQKIVIASAGPLDPIRGVLMAPTNFKTADGKHWGVVKLAQRISKKTKLPVVIDNDAVAALMAEKWLGLGQRVADFIVVTLGTGVGTAVMVNNQVVRSGRNLHTELGHILMDTHESAPLCGCGNRGCAEAFLSGVNFTKLLCEEWGDPKLTGTELVARAHRNDPRAQAAFKNYGIILARYLCSLSVIFSPQRIILSGGFSNAYELFAQTLETELEKLMSSRRVGVDLLPKICVSTFRDEAGLLGAAAIGFQ